MKKATDRKGVRICVTLTEETANKLEACATSLGWSVSKLTSEVCEAALGERNSVHRLLSRRAALIIDSIREAA